MQNFDPALEIRIITTVLERKEPALVSVLNPDWFGMPVVKEIWLRLDSLRQNGKAIPSRITMSSDPVLSDNAKTLLKGDTTPFTADEVEQAVDQLDLFRQGRVILDMQKKVADIMKENDAKIPDARVEIQRCLSTLQAPDFAGELLSYGYENDKTLDFYEEQMAMDPDETFIPSGFNAIDKQQGGLSRGRVYTIGAPSGGGKSTLANDIAVRIAQGKHSVGYFSFEMSREECLFRTQANMTGIPHDKFLLKSFSAQERQKSDVTLAKFLAQLSAKGMRLDYHCPTKDINIPELFAISEPLNYSVVVVDYINLMAPINPKEALWWNIGEGFRLAKKYARRTGSVLIMLVQIDEDTGDIKYAKSIKHHSDGVWIWPWGPQEKETGLVEIEQIKLRNFKPVKFTLKAEFEYCRWTDSWGAGATTAGLQPSVEPMKL